MRGRTLAALAALAAVDLAVLALGYRAHTGSLPPLQRSSGGFEVRDSTSTEPTGSAADKDTVAGPVLLGVNAAGDVLRATRGACEARFDSVARIWTGNVDDGDRLAAVEAPGIREVLGLMVYADGSLRVSGLDPDCQPVTFDSTDDGATWRAGDAAEIWRLSGDVTQSKVTGPRGSRDVSCPAVQIVNLPARRAIATCSPATLFTLASGQQPDTFSASDYVQLSATAGPDDDRFFVFGATAGCMASLGVTSPADQTVEELDCFTEEKAPLAIASAEGVLVIQLGNDLRVSRDDGESFETVGKPAGEESTAAAS